MSAHGPHPDGSVALPPAADAVPALERATAAARRAASARPAWAGRRAGLLALGLLLGGTIAVVALATAGPSLLVPHSGAEFPSWDAGPLRLVFGHPSLHPNTLILLYSALVVVLVGAYVVAALAAATLPLRLVWGAVLALHLVLLMAPPLQLNDVFNYLGYARLGALHGFNPYTHVIGAESFDPVYRFASWRDLSSPYGPLFTALTYPLGLLPLPIAYWILKVVTVAASLGFLACVGRCARLLGRDPRTAVMFVAANPIYVFFAVGGFHNDFFMLLPATAAIALLLARRDSSAGAILMIAVAVKFTAILLLPFLLVAARPPERRLRLLAGVVAAGVPLAAMALALFGLALPNVAQQSGVVTGYSIPNLLGLLLGLGGSTQMLVRVLNVGVVLVVLWGLRRRDWLGASGWATIALMASLAWLMPWYVVWALPLAALGASPALRRVSLAFTLFLVLTFVPETSTFLGAHGINPMGTPQGQAATTYQQKLQSQ